MDDAPDADGRRINTAVALILLHTVTVIPLVLYIYANADAAAEASPFRPLITGYFSVETMISLMKAAIIVTLIGSAMGIISAALALKRRMWRLTVTLCLISAVIAILSFIGLIMGMVAFRLLLKAKPAFAD